ncbi:protein pinocchio isoform X3 [Apis mellifera]|uniref:Protein pinocchio isoform X3 n=1 Tax=Apis mellifera TaxID=7460 RepID=A0A7M7KZ52_APIME|nr:protein pinocchio isoform X3 [Apis mellifera]|eukprot:XP_026295219.1 protein pinocchio isoform X3 [Apis mellifera]
MANFSRDSEVNCQSTSNHRYVRIIKTFDVNFCLVTMESSNMTEFEENVSFDIDDPDFAPSKNTTITHNILRGMQFTDITFGVNKFLTHQNNMSVTTTVQPATESLSRHGSNISLSCHSSCGSVDDGLQGSHPQYQDTILTIEELRAQLNSCFTCGVSWSEEHVSLDCSECGGYSLQRPCPLCDGRCRTSWKRDLTMIIIKLLGQESEQKSIKRKINFNV